MNNDLDIWVTVEITETKPRKDESGKALYPENRSLYKQIIPVHRVEAIILAANSAVKPRHVELEGLATEDLIEEKKNG